MPEQVLWSGTVHDEAGLYTATMLTRHHDGHLSLYVGGRRAVFEDDEARSLWAALGEALQDGA